MKEARNNEECDQHQNPTYGYTLQLDSLLWKSLSNEKLRYLYTPYAERTHTLIPSKNDCS